MDKQQRQSKKNRRRRRQARMRRNSYQRMMAVSAGILAGSATGLWCQNFVTGLLWGIIVAGSVSGLCSLQWRRFFGSLPQAKVKANAALATIRPQLKPVLAIKAPLYLSFVLLMIGWHLIKPLFAVPMAFRHQSVRKYICYQLALLALLPVNFFCWWSIISIEKFPHSFWTEMLVIAYAFACGTGVVVVAAHNLLALLSLYIVGMFKPEDLKDFMLTMYSDSDFSSWLYCGLRDGKSPLKSTIYMLAIRISNVILLVCWPFVFVFWLLRLMATRRTGRIIQATAVLTATHLAASHSWGGINTGNTNFWLSLAVVLMIGNFYACKMGNFQRFRPEFPTFSWLEHSYSYY